MGGTLTAESPLDNASRWPVPPPDGYTVDDLFTIPDLPPHTELIDGSLVFVSPQRRFHARMIDLLITGLRNAVPPDLAIDREMTVVLDHRNAPEPDVSVVVASAAEDLNESRIEVKDVVLAVEVVSPDSESRDRETKPVKYARAGIPHFWLVEKAGTDHHPVVHVYVLDTLTQAYALTGIYHDQLKITVPFDIDIDISSAALQRL
ncbi:Uma2 family endonuclease [Streptomyces montanisoli]|uniref:Uma2 family endonuclease n=1 Tax=Streptomyces montanisoli TaxID=2798581 RepID=A0A940MDU2_9ACTN|nr:Uma2 family endonuclease [Streptomyces montanisoli]MBP0459197.1 Uma2 family endonuclease [Streptomyces montanisoli]